MKTIIGCAGVLLVWLVSETSLAQTLEQQRETLRGLAGVAVVVEPLNAEAEQDGLQQGRLQATVEKQLRAAGIPVLSKETWSITPGGPYLYVNVAALKKQYELYAYSIEVCLNQLVTLARDRNIRQFAETWETREVGTVGSDKLVTVQDSIARHVETFIAAYRTVNPVAAEQLTLRLRP